MVRRIHERKAFCETSFIFCSSELKHSCIHGFTLSIDLWVLSNCFRCGEVVPPKTLKEYVYIFLFSTYIYIYMLNSGRREDFVCDTWIAGEIRSPGFRKFHRGIPAKMHAASDDTVTTYGSNRQYPLRPPETRLILGDQSRHPHRCPVQRHEPDNPREEASIWAWSSTVGLIHGQSMSLLKLKGKYLGSKFF